MDNPAKPPSRGLLGRVGACGRRLLSGAVVALTLALVIVPVLAVFFRYILNDSLSWSEEVAGYLLAWLTFVGAACLCLKNEHIAFETFLDRFPAPVRFVIGLVHDLLILGFSLLLVRYGFQIAVSSMSISLTTVPVPVGVARAIVPVAGAVIALIYAVRIMRRLTGREPPRAQEDLLP